MEVPVTFGGVALSPESKYGLLVIRAEHHDLDDRELEEIQELGSQLKKSHDQIQKDLEAAASRRQRQGV